MDSRRQRSWGQLTVSPLQSIRWHVCISTYPGSKCIQHYVPTLLTGNIGIPKNTIWEMLAKEEVSSMNKYI